MLFTRPPLASQRISSIIALLTPEITLCFLSKHQTIMEIVYEGVIIEIEQKEKTKFETHFVTKIIADVSFIVHAISLFKKTWREGEMTWA